MIKLCCDTHGSAPSRWGARRRKVAPCSGCLQVRGTNSRSKVRPQYGPDQQILPRPKYHPTINPLPQTPSWDPRSVASEKIYPTSLIWSCTDHYNIPTWAKIAHSAISLYESVDHSATNLLLTGTDEKARHREMPHYRQLPADGLNFLHDVQIYMQGGRKAEIIHLKVTKTEFSRFGKNWHISYQISLTDLVFFNCMLCH